MYATSWNHKFETQLSHCALQFFCRCSGSAMEFSTPRSHLFQTPNLQSRAMCHVRWQKRFLMWKIKRVSDNSKYQFSNLTFLVIYCAFFLTVMLYTLGESIIYQSQPQPSCYIYELICSWWIECCTWFDWGLWIWKKKEKQVCFVILMAKVGGLKSVLYIWVLDWAENKGCEMGYEKT